MKKKKEKEKKGKEKKGKEKWKKTWRLSYKQSTCASRSKERNSTMMTAPIEENKQ